MIEERKRSRLAVLVLSAVTSVGCALTSKGEVSAIRWFTPEVTSPRLTSAQARPVKAIAVELGRVTSGINLRDKIAYRDDAFEVGFYEDKRWTERPEVYVRRALARSLYQDYGMRRAFATDAPIVDVDVVAFEHLRKPTPSAHIELHVLVRDSQAALVERTIATDVPIQPDAKDFDAVARAMAQALAIVGDETARVTEAAIMLARERRAHPAH